MRLLSNISKTVSRFIKNQVYVINNSRLFTTYYSETHEWLKISDKDTQGIVGITEYAQESMGDIVFCDLEEVGENLKKGNILGMLESVKASNDIHTPVSGDIIEINDEVIDDPALINEASMDKGWLIKINIENKEELKTLLTEEQYNIICEDSS